MYVKAKELVIRQLLEEDRFHLAKWLSDPKVLQYYEGRDRPLTMDQVMEDFYGDPGDELRCLIEYEHEPIGYIQSYPISDYERKLYGYDDPTDIVYGMDQFIGEPSHWNKGIGTQLVEMMMDYLVNVKCVNRIVMDPQTWNKRAIRCYEKCGFKKVKLLPNHEWHEGAYRDCWLIEYDRGRSKGGTSQSISVSEKCL